MCLCDESFTCVNPYCSIIICKDCLEYLITFSEKEKLLPKCPSKNCNYIFIYSTIIKNFSKNIINSYEQACFQFFLKENYDDLQNKIQEINLLKKIRTERIKFLKDTFPAAIYLTAVIAFKDKLKALDKKKTKKMNEIIKSSYKKCMNLTCKGTLNLDYKCIICDNTFCKKCEKCINNSETKQHICDPNNVLSISWINEQKKCPGCKLTVFKDQGCDSITCSNCNTNFEYSTGTIGGHGSSNTKLTVNVNEYKKLSNVYRDSISSNLLDEIIKLESTEPVEISTNYILVPLREYIKLNENFQKYAKDLSKRLELIILNKLKIIEYQKKIVHMENIILKKYLE
jgi:hypothetical protein